MPSTHDENTLLTYDHSQIELFVLIFAGVIILAGIFVIWQRMHAKQSGFGPLTLKALAIVIFVPSVLVVSLIINLPSEAVAALLGTVAGYIFSGLTPNDPDN